MIVLHLLTFYATNGLLLISLFLLVFPLWMIIWERRFVYSVHPFSRVITYFMFISGSIYEELITPCKSRFLL